MADNVRLSDTTLRALKLLLAAPPEGRSGAEISKGARIGSGTMYPMLARLETAGWLKGDWEDVSPREVGRPRRRFYSLTSAGRARARAAFAEFQDVPTGDLAWEILIGLLMNVLGNDLYDRCPRLAKWIICKAVARLPEERRAEYEEAWFSHLADCDTNVDQIRHALGIYWSVGGIINAAPRAKVSYRLDLIIAGSGMLALSVSGEAVTNLIAGMPWYLLPMYLLQMVSSIFVVIAGLRLRKEKGNIIEL